MDPKLELATARMQIAAREIVLWTTPSEPPKALQASECSELLDPMRASCLILAQHQPGKFREPPAHIKDPKAQLAFSSALKAKLPKWLWELNAPGCQKACVTASARVWYLEPKWLR